MIRVKDLSKKYGNHTILKNISLSIEDGDFVAITGESGKGKTTLLNLIGLLDRDYSGRIEIDGKTGFSERDVRMFQRNKFAYLFQNYALVENETVKQNMSIALRFQNLGKEQSRMKHALALVGLKNIENKKIFELSGGEQQRVALARAYLKRPKYVFADEPTGNLDVYNRDIVFELLKKMNYDGITVIFVTHDLELAESVILHFICLKSFSFQAN